MEEKKYTVYKHTSPDGKVYVGCTSMNIEGVQMDADINSIMPCTTIYRNLDGTTSIMIF